MDVTFADASGKAQHVTATPDHPWLVEREGARSWVETENLKPGDRLVTEDADRLTLQAITLRDGLALHGPDARPGAQAKASRWPARPAPSPWLLPSPGATTPTHQHRSPSPMTLSLHAASVGTFAARLSALDAILDKLAAHCDAKKIDPAAFLTARLFPDMLTFTQQVQLATDFANRASARLAGVDPLSLPDTETSIEALKARIATTLAFAKALDASAVEAGAERQVTFRTGPTTETTMPGAQYLIGFALPNFYFHVTTAYALLRAGGLEIGKRDFFGALG